MIYERERFNRIFGVHVKIFVGDLSKSDLMKCTGEGKVINRCVG